MPRQNSYLLNNSKVNKITNSIRLRCQVLVATELFSIYNDSGFSRKMWTFRNIEEKQAGNKECCTLWWQILCLSLATDCLICYYFTSNSLNLKFQGCIIKWKSDKLLLQCNGNSWCKRNYQISKRSDFIQREQNLDNDQEIILCIALIQKFTVIGLCDFWPLNKRKQFENLNKLVKWVFYILFQKWFKINRCQNFIFRWMLIEFNNCFEVLMSQ